MKKIFLLLMVTLTFGFIKKIETKRSYSTQEIKYITAKTGLIYRNKPKGKKLGKFEFNKKISITEHTNIFQEIKNGNKTIKGEWLGTKVNNKNVYVFGGFLSDTKSKITLIDFNLAKPNIKRVEQHSQSTGNSVLYSYLIMNYMEDNNSNSKKCHFKTSFNNNTIEYTQNECGIGISECELILPRINIQKVKKTLSILNNTDYYKWSKDSLSHKASSGAGGEYEYIEFNNKLKVKIEYTD